MGAHQQSGISIELPVALTYGGLALAGIGSIGPWATAPLNSAGGLDGDGKWTIVLAAIAAVILVRRGAPDIRAGLCCLAILAFGIYDAVHIHHELAKVTLYGQQLDHVGWGVYAVCAGAALTLAALIQRQRTGG